MQIAVSDRLHPLVGEYLGRRVVGGQVIERAVVLGVQLPGPPCAVIVNLDHHGAEDVVEVGNLAGCLLHVVALRHSAGGVEHPRRHTRHDRDALHAHLGMRDDGAVVPRVGLELRQRELHGRENVQLPAPYQVRRDLNAVIGHIRHDRRVEPQGVGVAILVSARLDRFLAVRGLVVGELRDMQVSVIATTVDLQRSQPVGMDLGVGLRTGEHKRLAVGHTPAGGGALDHARRCHGLGDVFRHVIHDATELLLGLGGYPVADPEPRIAEHEALIAEGSRGGLGIPSIHAEDVGVSWSGHSSPLVANDGVGVFIW